VRGIPGRVVGEVSDKHLAMMRRAAQSYVQRATRYASSSQAVDAQAASELKP
jgi:carbonic anhydrase/acetyltransferase-like protein (isoleucine patch superfamily)